jgi:hypothetical protein
MYSPFSGSNNNPIRTTALNREQAQLHAGFLLGLLFDPENRSDVFFRNFR